MDLKKSKIIITGGAGFISSHITDNLIKKQWSGLRAIFK